MPASAYTPLFLAAIVNLLISIFKVTKLYPSFQTWLTGDSATKIKNSLAPDHNYQIHKICVIYHIVFKEASVVNLAIKLKATPDNQEIYTCLY